MALGVRVVWMIAQNWRSVWDRRFTPQDRQLVNQASFFFLIPVSVLLHELGHAVAVWGFGKEVVDWGFYGFAGYVAYLPFGLNDIQQTVISAAGSLVNLVLCLIALGIVLFKKPPLRAAFNELLIGFAFISGANAFIVYPVLDMLSGLNGDWRQMYDSGVPWLSGLIVLVQVAVLAGGYWIFTNPEMKAKFARLTDVPPGYERGIFGGMQPAKIQTMNMNPTDLYLRDAVNRVSSGWYTRVNSQLQRIPGGTAMLMQWHGNNGLMVMAVRGMESGAVDIVRIPVSSAGTQGGSPRVVQRWGHQPDVDQLTLALRLAMEAADAEV